MKIQAARPIAILSLLAALVAGSGWLTNSTAHAASSLDILDRQRGQSIPEPLSKPKIKVTEDGALSGMSEGSSFTLNSLAITGNTVFTTNELFAPYNNLLGNEITFVKLSGIAADLTKKYREAGYLLSRVVIPEQEVEQAGANIRLHVVEGYIESIQFTGPNQV